MGDRITGVTALHEISRTRKAMNKFCTKVMLKSKDAGGVTAENPETEESEMDAKIIKSFAGLQARTGNAGALYVAQMEDDKVKSFFEQDADAQDAEVKAWDEAEKAKAAAAAEAEKAKSAVDPKVAALEAEVAELKGTVKSLTGGNADAALKEKAKSAYPNVPKAFDILKSIEGLTDEQKQPTLDMLKAQNDLNGSIVQRQIDPSTVEGTPANVLKSKVKAYAEANNVDENQAYLDVTADPANADLIQQVRDEEDAA